MTIDEIINESRQPGQIITDLMKKTIKVPAWSELVKEYNPKNHPVFTDKSYRDKPRKHGNGVEHMTRIGLAWQKLADKRIAEMMFGIPVQRIFKPKTDKEKRAAAVIEAIFKKNHIDAVNIKRARKLFAGCEFATIWYAQQAPTMYAGEKSLLKIRCKTYSPMPDSKLYAGESLYPLFDENDDMIALSVMYTRTLAVKIAVQYFDTYTAERHYRWVNKGAGWVADTDLGKNGYEEFNIGKIPGVYQNRAEPIWEDQSPNVYEAEWSLSRNGNYLRKNAKPTWVIFSDNTINVGKEKDDDTTGRNVVKYGANDKANYATWNQAIDALKFHIDAIKRNFFMELQLPDMSAENMKATPTSGKALEIMLMDSKMKVGDESGDWLETFEREINVVKEFAKKAVPELADAFDSLELDKVVITAYMIYDDDEKIKNASDMAGGKAVASLRTAVKYLGKVTDDEVDEEIQRIKDDESQGVQDVFAPGSAE